MGKLSLRLLSVLILSTWVAACGDDGGSGGPDARICTPVNDDNVCTTDVCENGLPVHNPVAVGTTCPTGTCNAAGVCQATGPSCTDGIKNGTETDIDCGGSCTTTATCDDGGGCVAGTDCDSGVCGTDNKCAIPACGDGVIRGTEMCDDGNGINGDGCDDGAGGSCRATACGNGTVTGTEVCDDGNNTNGDGCDNNCTASACGNGVTAGAEGCDDGDRDDGDGCSMTCTVETGYTCTGAISVCTTVCGDGIRAGAEACDDADTDAGDGCSMTCTVETGYTCTGTPSVCTSAVCGNGILEGAEACDQGGNNVANGDGCSSTCTVETGYTCTGTPSVCTTPCGDGITTAPETCDDSNTIGLDGCSATCRIEVTEIEPNEDGTPSLGGSGTAGNDFDGPGGMAVMNATNNGVINVANGPVTILAAISPAGDEDVFDITNGSAVAQTVQLDTWSRGTGFGIGVACGNDNATSVDTVITLRNAAGLSLAMNDDRVFGSDRCAALNYLLAPGATVYAHIIDWGDDQAWVPGYGLIITPTPVACGNGVTTANVEQCDDGNLTSGDGCSATCTVEGTTEVEPNEDGTPSTGGTGIAGNDFDAAGGMAVANSTAQGVVDVGTTGRTWLAALTPAGDEDVFALSNTSALSVEVTVNTYSPLVGLNGPCPSSFDTGITVRDMAGVSQTSNNDKVSGVDYCSRVSFIMAPGATRFVQVVESGDNAVIANYIATIARRPVVCGDGIVAGAEVCDDGNPTAGDGCSATCTVEFLYRCAGTPSVCTSLPATVIPLACTDMTGAAAVAVADLDDDYSDNAALPFSFPLYGTTMTNFSMSTNGWIAFFTNGTDALASSGPTNATTVPSTSTPNGYLAPFWDDLVVNTDGLRTKLTGTAGARTFTFEWNAALYRGAGNFGTIIYQAQIKEAGGIEFHYCSGTTALPADLPRIQGSGATIAAENAAGTVGHAVSTNAASITPGTTAIRWNIP